MPDIGSSESETAPRSAAGVESTLANARRRLLAAGVDGHWEGELSTSALSTATALFALALHDRARAASRHAALVRGGLHWLVRHQNADGGWGDTTLSHSNISTTALCWAALSVGGPECAATVHAAEAWLARAAGSLRPEHLAAAIAARYGKDRTFSVPILTMCALAGRLGEGREAWRYIPPLPFELAACPHDWFRWLKLPVVSYALPALIAMGQVGHHHRPTRNPAARLLRDRLRPRTLEVLRAIQPEGGGFLEAAPLTSFVTMSLVAAGQAEHPVTESAVDFLVRSVRPDGSWPIDTNLATWLTTLAVNALSAGSGVPEGLEEAERRRIADWLLGQQYREIHPYTRAAPGGWAWTDLPGGVPDADDTAGALLALHHLGLDDPHVPEAAAAGVGWLLDLQNADGGMPTFCRGWGALPFDRSGADLTAHALLAWAAWRDRLSPILQQRIDRARAAALGYLAAQQRPDGSWVPLWFGNQDAPGDENPTYGTARVLPALLATGDNHPRRARMVEGAVRWLLGSRNPDGGWGGAPGVASSIEETALAVQALCGVPGEQVDAAVARGAAWLVRATEGGTRFPPSPIGFYFAKLWYFEREYPLLFTIAALTACRRRLSQGPSDGQSPVFPPSR